MAKTSHATGARPAGTHTRMNEHERTKDTTGQGYPEEHEPGTGIDAREHPEDDVTPDTDAPHTTSEQDREPSQATGNPHASGG